MSALFRKKERPVAVGKTFLVIDVENGSTAAGLAHVALGQEPKLFAETRVRTELPVVLSSAKLARSIETVFDEALANPTEAAAYLRATPETAPIGEIAGAHIFLSAPWAHAVHEDSKFQWEFEPNLIDTLHKIGEGRVASGGESIQFHPFGRAAARSLAYITSAPTLVVHVTGEITELLVAYTGSVLSRATMPLGLHTLLRTLKSHGNLSTFEAHSSLRLPLDGHPYAEPLSAAGKHYVQEFSEIVAPLIHHTAPVAIFVIAPPGADILLSQMLAIHVDPLLFNFGTTIRTLQPSHIEPHLAIHPTTTDVPLMLETLFINSTQNY